MKPRGACQGLGVQAAALDSGEPPERDLGIFPNMKLGVYLIAVTMIVA